LTELGNRVTEAEGKIEALEADAEKHADKDYVDGELAKKADKTALEETNGTLAEVKATVDNFFSDDAAINDTIDTLKEIAQYIANDKEGAADLTARVGALETKVDVEKVSTAIGVETTRATEAETALGNRIKDLEDNKAGYATTGQVATAKQEAIDAAAGDATAKANAAQSAAEAKAAELDTALHTAISAEIDADVKALADGAVKTNADDIAAIKEALTWGTF
jgi:chromosome segregation ATPase